ncbi:hypothetical protein Kpho02_00110 [Kitasatospora phosalacinea]|uniref:Gram-positive cocci surface proteins LPxTG domain-containing protein n=1 Tax=Kitasatospora phosalacinea TaxID=2065 RepID=A0A9W6UZZ1_9ACTN|nr:hypothetical protein [Kitasatospora phosalacinea]GLW67712.1 hypothetical protein Kpho02_00110 [Kitasatospora phosalacinea]
MTPTLPPPPTGRRLRPLRAAALAGAAVLPLTVFAAPAHAAGDNGDVKIHDSATAADSQNDDPKVCKFYLDGLNFDLGQSVTWHIDQQPPTGNAQVLAGNLVMPTGNARTGDLTLPDGHYKLFWNFTGENGDAKQKVFTVDCAGVGSSPPPSGSPSPVGNGGGSPSPGASPSGKGGVGGGSSPTPGGPGQGGPGRPPHGGVAAGAGGSSQDLNPAEVTVGAALIAGASYLVVRRRRRSRR